MARRSNENPPCSVLAELRFQSELKGGQDPVVVAWGPFRHPETWNTSIAQAKIINRGELQAGGGITGADLKSTVGREKELAYDKVDFDEGRIVWFLDIGSEEDVCDGFDVLDFLVHGLCDSGDGAGEIDAIDELEARV